MGMVFQEDALWPRMTVAENVGYALGLQNRPRAERRERVGEAPHRRSGSTAWAAKRPDELSRSRPPPPRSVSVHRPTRALAIQPELLILDDPVGRLETRVRDEIRDEVRRLHAETGLTTLVLGNDARERSRWPIIWP